MHQHGKSEPHRNRLPETGSPHPQGTETMQCPTRLRSAALPLTTSLPFLEHDMDSTVLARVSVTLLQCIGGTALQKQQLVCCLFCVPYYKHRAVCALSFALHLH